MLGRFVAPVARLAELAAEAARHQRTPPGPWHLAALAGSDIGADLERVREINAAHEGQLLIDVVEAKLATAADIAAAARLVGRTATLHVELPIADDPRALVTAVRDAGVRAKVRTGGLTPDAFPTAAQLARFIARCAEAGVPWKATAGLHHPLRAEHRLTYERDAPRGTMFGFLNVFAAGAFARAGLPEAELAALLEERDVHALEFGDERLRWRGHELDLRQLADARESFAIAFGSCSFREPVDDLTQLALL
jgi:hypothetical protein